MRQEGTGLCRVFQVVRGEILVHRKSIYIVSRWFCLDYLLHICEHLRYLILLNYLQTTFDRCLYRGYINRLFKVRVDSIQGLQALLSLDL